MNFKISDEDLDAIDITARATFKRHQSGVRGQQVSASDSWDSHIVWATAALLAARAASASETGAEGEIYQVSFADEEGWCDAPKEVFDRHPAHARRIVYAAPQPAQADARVEPMDRFIAEFGHRLATLLGIDAFDIADRDAQLVALLQGANQ
jgi:hypothetical protein